MRAKIYIASHERAEAIEAYKSYLNRIQIVMLEDEDISYWLELDYSKATSTLTPVRS